MHNARENPMIERTLILFEQPGPSNTDDTLQAAKARMQTLGIKHLVVASSTGDTALKAAELFEGTDTSIVAVTLHAGLWEKYCGPLSHKQKPAEQLGVRFVTATHTLMGNVEAAIKEKFGGVPPVEVIAYTYYTFSQGMKVAVEVAVMAADAGCIPADRDIVAIAGSDEGADTAIVLRPAYSTNFFDLKIREIIAMPR